MLLLLVVISSSAMILLAFWTNSSGANLFFVYAIVAFLFLLWQLTTELA